MGHRAKRVVFEHAYHHVTSRGTDQWIIFHDDADRERFLLLLARVCRRYGTEIISHCLMDNHFHLIVYDPKGAISDAMRDLKSAYGTYHNDRHRRTGPVHGARFFSKVIRDEKQLLDEIRYIHRNPYAIDPAMDLAEYRWSSHPMYLGIRPCPEWLRPDIALSMFGSDYQRTIEAPKETDKVQNRRARIVPAPGAGTIRTESERVPPSLADVLSVVARVAGTDISEVRPRVHNGLIGLAVILAADLGGFTPSEIADPFGFRSAAAVKKQLQRAKTRVEKDPQTAALLGRMSAALRHRPAA